MLGPKQRPRTWTRVQKHRETAGDQQRSEPQLTPPQSKAKTTTTVQKHRKTSQTDTAAAEDQNLSRVQSQNLDQSENPEMGLGPNAGGQEKTKTFKDKDL